MTTTVNSEQHPSGAFLVWDKMEIAKAHTKTLREENPELSYVQALSAAMKDGQLFANEWDFLLDCLADMLARINPEKYSWVVPGSGWRSGRREFDCSLARTASAFLFEVLPSNECSFKIFVHGDPGDSPTKWTLEVTTSTAIHKGTG